MKAHSIPLIETGYLSDLVCDYLNNKKELSSFHSGIPSFENLYQQALTKKEDYLFKIRKTLCNTLNLQYNELDMGTAVTENLKLLENNNTLTVTTGHQLCLMTGPLYFIYKIVSTIKLCQQLKEKYSDLNFVPVYWMATEDHDFEEISSFIFRGKKFKWNNEAGGAVGKIKTESLGSLLELFKQEFGSNLNAVHLKNLIEESYEVGEDLSHATRIFVHSLFKSYGLLIIDANDGCLILGICNGFQILTETGLLKGTLLRNKNLKFINKDIQVKVTNNETKFSNKYKKDEVLKINIAHNEGNFFTNNSHLQELKENNLIAFKYCDEKGNIDQQSNPNGSLENIAGIYNSKKNILGMMPHPERMVDKFISNTDGVNLFSSLLN